jgi:hypothetical protein
LFTNLYFASEPFRDHNWTDFFGQVRRVASTELERWTKLLMVASVGFDLALLATIYFTLSGVCYEGFRKDYPDMQLDRRDYVLSKLFQFLFVPITMRQNYSDSNGSLRRELEAFLDIIPEPPVASVAFDWKAFYADLRHCNS